MHYFVNKKKCCQIFTYSVLFYFTLFICAHFCNEIERCQLWMSLKYFSILGAMKNNVIFEYVPWKNVWFCFISIVWVYFNHKTNLDFESHWNTLILFWLKRYHVRFENVPWKNAWFCCISIVWVHFNHKTNLDFESHWNTLIFFS